MNKESILIAFLGNIRYDTRTANFYKSFRDKGYNVKVVCFDWTTISSTLHERDISIYHLNKGRFSIIFYLRFAITLLAILFNSKAEIYFAEDVYTLPLVTLAGKLKGAKVFYDSREVYSHLAGLSNRKYLQKILRLIESICITKVSKTITTGELDSAFIEKEYNIGKTLVLRNLPLYQKIDEPFDFRKYYSLSFETKIFIYQGVVLHGRGLKIIFEAFEKLENCVLVIIGDGEKKNYYEKLSVEKKLTRNVFFYGKVELSDLLRYTAGGDFGLAIIENLSLSYYYALPNKMFEYILTGLPVIASNFPQMKDIIDKYKVGIYVDPENVDEVIAVLKKCISDKLLTREYRENCFAASKELIWEKEIEKLIPFLEN